MCENPCPKESIYGTRLKIIRKDRDDKREGLLKTKKARRNKHETW